MPLKMQITKTQKISKIQIFAFFISTCANAIQKLQYCQQIIKVIEQVFWQHLKGISLHFFLVFQSNLFFPHSMVIIFSFFFFFCRSASYQSLHWIILFFLVGFENLNSFFCLRQSNGKQSWWQGKEPCLEWAKSRELLSVIIMDRR